MKQEIKNAVSRLLSTLRNLRTFAAGRRDEPREEDRQKEVQGAPQPAEVGEQEEVAERDRESCTTTVS